MSNAPDSPLPILGPRVQNAILRDFHTTLDAVIGAAHEHIFAGLDLGDTISWAHEQVADALDDKFNLTNNEAGNLADFLALVFKHLDNPEPAHSGDATETILTPGYFCTRHHALMRRHIDAYAAIASEALSLYDQDEADEGDIVPLTVDRFIAHLTKHNEHVSPNFRRAVSDFALLGTLLHITRYTLGL